MKKKVTKLIHSYVDDLPIIGEETKLGVTGATILEKNGKDAKTVDGKRIKENKMYTIPVELQVNHYNRAKQRYQEAEDIKKGSGEMALQRYRESVLDVALKQQKAEQPPVVMSV